MKIPSSLAARVRQRAGHRCEYCLMSQSLQGAAFHIEHVIPKVLGGETVLENLALACSGCNLHKAGRISAEDPGTGMIATLYNPRKESWRDHFEWRGESLAAKSSVGRATIKLLRLNHPRRLLIRKAEQKFGLFPPP